MGLFDRMLGGDLSLTDARLIEMAVGDGARSAQQNDIQQSLTEQTFIADVNRVRYAVNKRLNWPERDAYENPGILTIEQFEMVVDTIQALEEDAQIQPRSAKIIRTKIAKARRR